jgi:peroxiredoxin
MALPAVIAQTAAPPKAATPAKATVDKPIKDFKLTDLMHELKENEKEDDAKIALSQFKGKKTVLLYFMSEHCSVTRLYDARMGKLLKNIKSKDVVVLGVRCSANDTPEGLKKWVEAKNFSIPLLNDEKGALSSYFGIVRTPTFAVIDKKGVLRYYGSFDDAPDEPDVKKKYLPDAVTAVLTDKDVPVKRSRPFG